MNDHSPSRTAEEETAYPFPLRIRLDTGIAIFAWTVFITLPAGILLFWIFGAVESLMFPLMAMIVLGLSALRFVFAISHRCPRCGRCPTIQMFSTLHADAEERLGLSGWSVVAIDVWTRGRFRCIHCGTAFRV